MWGKGARGPVIGRRGALEGLLGCLGRLPDPRGAVKSPLRVLVLRDERHLYRGWDEGDDGRPSPIILWRHRGGDLGGDLLGFYYIA